MADDQLSLTSHWYIAPGSETACIAALRQLAADVQSSEPDTLTYLVHTPLATQLVDGFAVQSCPPSVPNAALFFEVYRTPLAFVKHVKGRVFTEFVAKHGSLFVNANGSPFTTVEFLTRIAGFTRAVVENQSGNRHPAVMFEVIANDQTAAKTFYSKVFGWQYQTGTGGFAYVHFPERTPPLLGGIGQADPSVPGFEPGHSFYILVDDLEAAIDRAVAAGGKRHMDPASVDGYHFAMIEDPEGNPVGLILPFQN